MIKYQIYQDEFYDDLKQITIESFELTSFNTDLSLPKNIGGKVAWELWCKPILRSEKNKYCIVAVSNKKAVGYIIYGADADCSKVINKKIGNIILIAVKKEFRNKYNIAENLVNTVVNIFKKYEFDIITVGTDLDNLPALITYIKLGFRPILSWATFRNYFNAIKDEDTKPKIMAVDKNEKKIIKNFLENISRPTSLLIDRNISELQKKTLLIHIKEKVKEEIQNNKLNLFVIKENKKTGGFFTVIKKEDISQIIGKDFCRINDIIFLHKKEKANIRYINSILQFLKKNGCEIVEIFVKLNEWLKIKYLCKTGFILVHNAITLHKYL